jgi:anhydro-N-acetylmuramic acid kinase
MSGTSLDGIDVAVVEIRGRRVQTLGFASTPYPEEVRRAILAVSNTTTTTGAISQLNFRLGELYSRAILRLLRKTGPVELIGCHGQTIYHEGPRNTLQIGEASVIAERTGVPVISDFRTRDIAAGGHGAPLVPFLDYWMFRHPRRTRVSLNIGGIANISVIPAAAGPEQVVAFDTGPGNMVMDGLVYAHTGGALTCDHGGKIAARGKVHRDLLDELLRDPYYRMRPPKSAGREQYGTEFLERLRQTGLPFEDLVATATALTGATIAGGVRNFVKGPADLIVAGGGAHNPRILAQLAAYLPGVAIAFTSDFGIDVDAKEAIAFALLAHETWLNRPSNLPSATGARKPAVLGKISR